MALFTDASFVTLGDLMQYERSLSQIAASHSINVDTKISLASSVIGDKLLLWLLGVGAADPQWVNRRLLGLSTVVVTPPLNRWLCFESLSRFFAEACNIQLNTRFEGKWTEYQHESQNANGLVQTAGIGIVYKPLPKPAMPLVSLQSGSAPAQSMFVQTAWVDALGGEGALSPVNGLVLGNNSSITVSMAEGVGQTPPAAVGWNIYLSSDGASVTKQNSSSLKISSTWQLPIGGLVSGPDPVNGQSPDFYIPLFRPIQRG